MSVQFTCVVFSGDTRINEMMHYLDVFEPFKVVAKPCLFEITRESEPSDENLKAIAGALKDGLEKEGRRVVAVFFPLKKAGAWADNTVKVISDGGKWVMFRDLLSAYCFEGEYNEAQV